MSHDYHGPNLILVIFPFCGDFTIKFTNEQLVHKLMFFLNILVITNFVRKT